MAYKRVRRVVSVPCDSCWGTGNAIGGKCRTCRGTGEVPRVVWEIVSEDEVARVPEEKE